ncbi:hypothetical protein NE553_15410, partial [Eggerthella lenta]|nr:hypothetical protein [Eggerthella lenta]
MNKPAQKIMAGVAGAVLLASGTGAALAAQQPATAEEGSRPAGATHTVADLTSAPSGWARNPTT